MANFDKTPSAELDYTVDWTNWLDSSANEQLNTSVWDISGDGQLEKMTDFQTDYKTQILLRGGTIGRRYTVRNIISTKNASFSRKDSRSFTVIVGLK